MNTTIGKKLLDLR